MGGLAKTAVACASFVAASWCLADSNEWEVLRGLKVVSVSASINSPSFEQSEVRECGLVDTGQFKPAAEFVLQRSRIKVTEPRGAQATFTVNVVVDPIHSTTNGRTNLMGCTVDVNVILSAPINGITAWGGKVDQAVLFEVREHFATGAIGSIPGEISDTVTSLTKAFVVEWSKRN